MDEMRTHPTPTERLKWACSFYDRWYRGEVIMNAGSVAYELVTAIRQFLSESDGDGEEERK